MGGFEFSISDISRTGTKFIANQQFTPGLGSKHNAVFRFATGMTHATVLEVVRTVGDLVMVHFMTPIPKDILASEFDRLKHLYGTVEVK